MAIDIGTGAALKKAIKDDPPIPREFVLKQLENEINSGFAFVAAARRAYKLSDPALADGALDQASEKHEHVRQEVIASPSMQVRSIIHQLTELREAIDRLRETQFQPSAKIS